MLRHTDTEDPVVKFTGWEEYRLGDVVKWRQWKEEEADGKAYHLANFPNSIAAAYFRETDDHCAKLRKGVHDTGTTCNSNIEVLARLAHDRQTCSMREACEEAILPSNQELVCHLRIGDVIEKNSHSVEALLYLRDLSQYVKTLAFYSNVTAHIPPGIDSVTLVTGSHQKMNLDKSTRYVKKVAAFWRDKGFKVSIRSMDPDSDFIYMSHARHFISSGGGECRSMATMFLLPRTHNLYPLHRKPQVSLRSSPLWCHIWAAQSINNHMHGVWLRNSLLTTDHKAYGIVC
jgi:hypothetical protein